MSEPAFNKFSFHSERVAYGTRDRMRETRPYLESFQATLAIRMLDRFGLITGMNDGEDRAGRAKTTVMPPREVVVRACDLAGEMTDELLKRGWLKDNPGEKALWPEAFAQEEETAKAKK